MNFWLRGIKTYWRILTTDEGIRQIVAALFVLLAVMFAICGGRP